MITVKIYVAQVKALLQLFFAKNFELYFLLKIYTLRGSCTYLASLETIVVDHTSFYAKIVLAKFGVCF